MSLRAKYLQFTLYEHSARAGHPPKAMVASLSADPYSFLSVEEREECELQHIEMSVEGGQMMEAPVIWFTVGFPQFMECEAVRGYIGRASSPAEISVRRAN